MFVNKEEMPGDSRIWIYQSDRKLSALEEEKIAIDLRSFIEKWTSHNVMLKASFDVCNRLFIILMLDEKHASAGGCSIDSSVHFLEKIGKELNLDLFDRNVFAYKEENDVKLIKRADFEFKVNTGELNDQTIVYNNLIQTKKELESAWEIPLGRSWHKMLL